MSANSWVYPHIRDGNPCNLSPLSNLLPVNAVARRTVSGQDTPTDPRATRGQSKIPHKQEVRTLDPISSFRHRFLIGERRKHDRISRPCETRAMAYRWREGARLMARVLPGLLSVGCRPNPGATEGRPGPKGDSPESIENVPADGLRGLLGETQVVSIGRDLFLATPGYRAGAEPLSYCIAYCIAMAGSRASEGFGLPAFSCPHAPHESGRPNRFMANSIGRNHREES